MRPRFFTLLLLALGGPSLSTSAEAGEVDAILTTLVSGRQDARDGKARTVVPVLQLVSIRAKDLDLPGLDNVNLVFGGWGRVDPADPVDDELATGDIDVATIEATALRGRLALRGGRQLIIGGAARNVQIDGLSTQYRVWRKLGATLYGGHPVTREFEIDRGDAVAGSRVYWRQSIESEVGLSFIHLRDEGRISRQDLGLDARYRPIKPLTTTAYALWSTTEARLAEVDLGADWRARANLNFGANYRRTAPDLFLSRGSILSVFSEERRDEVGARSAYRPIPRLRLLADYAYTSLEGGSGFRAGARASLFLGVRTRSRVSAEFRVFDTPDNRYYRSRLSGTHRPTPSLSLGLDADAYRLQEDINGENLSLNGLATATYTISAGWHATAVGVAGSTPFYARRLEVMAKLVWGQIRRVREVLP